MLFYVKNAAVKHRAMGSEKGLWIKLFVNAFQWVVSQDKSPTGQVHPETSNAR